MILLSVLDQSSLGNKTFPTLRTGKVLLPGVTRHVNLQVVRLVENFTTHLTRPGSLDP